MPYAENTDVSSDKSRAEIERTLARYGADQFMYGWDRDQAVVMFRAHGRHIKFLLPLPNKDSPEFKLTPAKRYERTPEDAYKAWEQACRQKWRALALAVKAKLEAVETGIASFEDEFLAYTVLPDGQTVGRWLAPQLDDVYEHGTMPSLLPALGPGA